MVQFNDDDLKILKMLVIMHIDQWNSARCSKMAHHSASPRHGRSPINCLCNHKNATSRPYTQVCIWGVMEFI